MALPILPPELVSLNEYLMGLEQRVATLETPTAPTPLFACLAAHLPDAPTYINCFAYVTDTKITVASDGTDWRRQDTGDVI